MCRRNASFLVFNTHTHTAHIAMDRQLEKQRVASRPFRYSTGTGKSRQYRFKYTKYVQVFTVKCRRLAQVCKDYQCV